MYETFVKKWLGDSEQSNNTVSLRLVSDTKYSTWQTVIQLFIQFVCNKNPCEKSLPIYARGNLEEYLQINSYQPDISTLAESFPKAKGKIFI